MFTPPADAKLVDEFPGTKRFKRYRKSAGLPEPVRPETWAGKPAPEVQLKGSEGKTISLSSLRGKPVLIDVWSTTCIPCREMMPDLKKLYGEVAQKGQVFFTVDRDDDPDAASEFLSREHVPWTNYHDPDGAVQKAFKSMGVPFQVLIDPDGKVTFAQVGDDMSKLRTDITTLAPQYSSMALAGETGKPQ